MDLKDIPLCQDKFKKTTELLDKFLHDKNSHNTNEYLRLQFKLMKGIYLSIILSIYLSIYLSIN
jgi:hypothetical protein